MLKQVFLARFEPVVARYGPWKIPKCLENRLFQDQKCVKNGSKTRFSTSDRGPFGMLKQVLLAHFEPVTRRVLGHGKCQNALKMGRFMTKNGSKMGQKRVFTKVIVGQLRCSNKCFQAVLSPRSPVLAHGESPNAFTYDFSSCFFPKFKKSAKGRFSREMTYFFDLDGPKIGGGGSSYPAFVQKYQKP